MPRAGIRIDECGSKAVGDAVPHRGSAALIGATGPLAVIARSPPQPVSIDGGATSHRHAASTSSRSRHRSLTTTDRRQTAPRSNPRLRRPGVPTATTPTVASLQNRGNFAPLFSLPPRRRKSSPSCWLGQRIRLRRHPSCRSRGSRNAAFRYPATSVHAWLRRPFAADGAALPRLSDPTHEPDRCGRRPRCPGSHAASVLATPVPG
jgi:hypothetical protein